MSEKSAAGDLFPIESPAQNQHRHEAGQQERSEPAHHHQAQTLPTERAELDRPDGNAFLGQLEYPGRGERFGGVALIVGQLGEANPGGAALAQLRQQSALALELTGNGEAGERDGDERRR